MKYPNSEDTPCLSSVSTWDRESAKIACGEAHFKALQTGDNPAKFVRARNLNDVISHL